MLLLKLASRSLFKPPVVSAIAVLSMALGIGANVAISSIFNQILLRPLPVHEPDQLVNLAPVPDERARSIRVRRGRALTRGCCVVRRADTRTARGSCGSHDSSPVRMIRLII